MEEKILYSDIDANSIVESCIPDAVIIICYVNQKIVVPYSALGSPAVAILTSEILQRALNNRGYFVSNDREEERLVIQGLGHAGVCIISGQDRKAYYYEFGRYDRAQNGQIRWGKHFGESQSVEYSGENPELGSLRRLCDVLRKTNYDEGIDFKSVYIKAPCSRGRGMKRYAENARKNGRAKYDLNGNHCMTFAIDVAAAGGVDVSVARRDVGLIFNSSDNEIISDVIDQWSPGYFTRIGAWFVNQSLEKDYLKEEFRNKSEAAMNDMQVPALQIEALQKIYRDLNHAPFNFEGFPSKYYAY